MAEAPKSPSAPPDKYKDMRVSMTSAGLTQLEQENIVYNLEAEGGASPRREMYSVLPNHQGKTTEERRLYYFQNKNQFYI